VRPGRLLGRAPGGCALSATTTPPRLGAVVVEVVVVVAVVRWGMDFFETDRKRWYRCPAFETCVLLLCGC